MYAKNSKCAFAVALVLAGAAGFSGLAFAQTEPGNARPGNATPVELPPAKPGCYHYFPGNGGWHDVRCDSDEYIKEHIPRPELLIGVGETTIKGKSPAPFTSNTVRVRLSQLGAETDINPKTDLPEHGENAYSIQANVFFTGSNGVEDGIQFTNQANPESPGSSTYVNNVCIWQIDIISQKYDPTCTSFAWSSIIGQVSGATFPPVPLLPNLLLVAVPLGGGEYAAVVSFDKYGLTDGKNWDNVSGGLLGEGGGSEAFFAGREGIATTTVEASTCIPEDPFVTSSGFPQCTSATELDKRATTIVSPGPATKGFDTVETNNLQPVTGNPISHLPSVSFPNPWVVEVEYAATPTGLCPSGKPPLCK